MKKMTYIYFCIYLIIYKYFIFIKIINFKRETKTKMKTLNIILINSISKFYFYYNFKVIYFSGKLT